VSLVHVSSSPRQNITALEVSGTFDDRQALVKQAFLTLSRSGGASTSANSINVARWLPQQLYYCFAMQQGRRCARARSGRAQRQLRQPSAGLLAQASGAGHFIAACTPTSPCQLTCALAPTRPARPCCLTLQRHGRGQPQQLRAHSELFDNDLRRLRAALSADTIP
jgi:threonine synthase